MRRRSLGMRYFFIIRNSSCGKVMFSQASVILFTGRVSVPVHAGIHTTPREIHPRADTTGQTPPPQANTPPSRDGNCNRLLECILVVNTLTHSTNNVCFYVVHQCITKKRAHYKKRVPITCKQVLETTEGITIAHTAQIVSVNGA